MNIVIVGAGDVGFHIAKLLSFESQNIYVIDLDDDKLDYINNHIDVIAIKGDATLPSVLRQAKIEEADLLLTVTESQNTNFTIAVIGKRLGAKKTFARINNPELLHDSPVDLSAIGLDYLISPEELAADEIISLMEMSVFNESIEFENGKLLILGAKVDARSPIAGMKVMEIKSRFTEKDYLIVAIKRIGTDTVIIPRGDTRIEVNDQIYFAVPNENFKYLHKLLGKEAYEIRDVMILGGSTIGKKAAAKLAEKGFRVKIIEIDRKTAYEISEELPDVLVIHGDGRDVELLEEENIDQMDAFVAVTGNSETNILSCLVAKNKGVMKTVSLVENIDYIQISQTIGIDTLINKKLLAAGSIFAHVREGDVVAVANVFKLNAELMEFRVNENLSITGKTVKEIKFPRNSVLSGIIRNDRVIIPSGNDRLLAGDKVILLVHTDTIDKVEELFK
jgi:trk system potassium uptake protein TrkA